MVQRLTSLFVAASAAAVAPSSASFLRPRQGDALALDSRLSADDGGARTWYSRSTTDLKNASLDFTNAILTHSNLGDMGPDEGEPVLRFAKVGTQDDTVYDMVIEVAKDSSYDGDTNKNVLNYDEKLAQINIYCGTSSNFLVKLCKHETNIPITVDRFFMSVFDIDSGNINEGNGVETNEIGPVSSFYMDPNDQLDTTRDGDGFMKFVATQTGEAADNPTDPWALTDVQSKRAVMLEFRETSSFFMSMASTPGKSKRNMLFAGPSGLLDNGFGPCKYKQTVDLKLATMAFNNLDGSSALVEKKMAFSNVMTIDGTSVDLTVKPIGVYQPGTAEQNGMRGDYAQINVKANASATFRFSFTAGGNAYPVNDLVFAFYDIDGEAAGGTESLKMLSGGGTYFLSDSSTIEANSADLSSPVFTATTYGSIANNPSGSAVSDAQLDNAVSFYFHRATHFFDISFTTTAVKAPRNFAFGGDTLACGR